VVAVPLKNGDDQSLERDLSTFSAHVMHLRDTLDDADANTLVLIDEVAVGTAPEQGAALARSVLEALADRGTRAAVTTHYEPVKAMAASDERFVSASVGFDLEAMEPTFQLHIGSPGSSGALMVARRLGMPEAIVGRAEELLGGGRAGIDELLAAADAERRRLEVERAEIDEIRRDVESDRRAAAAALASAKLKERQAREGAHSDAVQALRRARDELDRVRTGMRRKRAGVVADTAKDEVAKLARAVAEHAPASEAPEGSPPPVAELKPGVAVAVPSLRGRGTVVEAPRRGKVIVQLGNIRTTVAVDAVRLEAVAARKPRPKPRAAPAPTSKRRRRDEFSEEVHEDDKAPARTRDNTLDIRGERVEDALARIDRFFDDSLLAERDVVFIIHGHGTGALRRAVREQADQHPVVKRSRPGGPADGGDGITIAWLDV
jgi:DNA mismatch repair protein MutS2